MNPIKSLASATWAPLVAGWNSLFPSAGKLPNEVGARVASDLAMERSMRQAMFVDYERRAMVAMMRTMDSQDGRVKMVHGRIAGDVIRGGLVMQTQSPVLQREWQAFQGRLQLNNAEKLKSDARGQVMEGNLPLQLVLDDSRRVAAAVRMPSDTLVPMTAPNGRFKDPAVAFEQRDVMTGQVLARFAAWQLALGRLDPQNWDDMGSMGRPLLDGCASTWRKLVMTEEDLVLRRRMRAPLRLAHILEGASTDELNVYRQQTEGEKGDITTDFYLNKKGGVQAVQGDANLDHIADVAHLLSTFFAGTPAPKALFGYTDNIARDVLEDMKRQYYDHVDGLQDAQGGAYAFAFRMHLLLQGIDPGPDEFYLRFAQRRTETANQVADLGLKWMALGLPDEYIHREMGLDPQQIRDMKIRQATSNDPYPNPLKVGPDGLPLQPSTQNHVSVTPGNAPKGESATAIAAPGGNGGRGRS
ncbi:hypothetical protein [Variovorax sp. HJSM1_2]|uniref:hypothetical protein n=1 Tax=Variovorax sp. HJSM1_2 TaxID=3366263 RepID=UPI003BBD9997